MSDKSLEVWLPPPGRPGRKRKTVETGASRVTSQRLPLEALNGSTDRIPETRLFCQVDFPHFLIGPVIQDPEAKKERGHQVPSSDASC